MAIRNQNEIPTDSFRRETSADQTMAGAVIKVAGHRFAISTAKILAAMTLVATVAWNAAAAQAHAFLARIEKIEETDRALARQIDLHDRKIEAQDAALANQVQALAQIQASLARIDARVAEIQVTLMRGRIP